jgi:hypothetical protein
MQTSSEQQSDSPLDFSLKIMVAEKSKDSHSTIRTWRVQDNKLAYTQASTGRRAGKDKVNTTQELSAEKIKALREIIGDFLHQNITVPKHSEFNVPYNATNCVWELYEGGKTFRIELYDLSKNITEDRIYQQLQQIVQILQ